MIRFETTAASLRGGLWPYRVAGSQRYVPLLFTFS